jgi:nitronate monooxygenase
MWDNNRLCTLLGTQLPLIQAPMAGSSTAELAIAASRAGALGSIAAAMLNPEQLQDQCRQVKEHSNGRYNVNFFVHAEPTLDPAKDEAMRELLKPAYDALELTDVPKAAVPFPSFSQEQFDIMMHEQPSVVSFHFGLPDDDKVRALQDTGIKILCSATSVAEARILQSRGINAIIAQGFEAGGHRGTFAKPYETGQVGTMALVPQIVDAVEVPVIAAGGIGDGRGIAAAMALGADGVQIGTSFLRCPESATNAAYRDALKNSTDDETRITHAFSGRPARGLNNTYVKDMAGKEDQLPDFPIPNSLTGPLRAKSGNLDSPDYMSLWSGQAGALARDLPAGELIGTLMREAEDVIGDLHSKSKGNS